MLYKLIISFSDFGSIMCVTFLMVNPDAGDDQWQFVLINNRDETYDRPTSIAGWKNGVLAGRDMKLGSSQGSWLAMNDTGRIGVLMNILEPPEKAPPNALSRGPLVIDYVKNAQHTPLSYVDTLNRGELYPGFSLLLLQRTNNKEKWNTGYFTNRGDANAEIFEMLPPGVYGFGNSARNRPFRKAQRGLQVFQQTLAKHLLTTDSDKWEFVNDLIRMLEDRTACFPDSQLQSQGTHLNREQQEKLSACFVQFPAKDKYGTRTHTVILIDGKNNVTYVERTMREDDWKAPWIETKYEFPLKMNDQVIRSGM